MTATRGLVGVHRWLLVVAAAVANLAVWVGALALVLVSIPAAAAVSPTASSSRNVAFDLATVDGSRIASAELAGRPTIVWFWAPWCPWSQSVADEVAAEAQRSGDRVAFVGMGGQGSLGYLRDFVDRYDVGGIEHGADLSGEVAAAFGVTNVPTFVVLPPEGGYRVYRGSGAAEHLGDIVDDLVG